MSTEVISGTTINRIRRRTMQGESFEVHDLLQPGLSIRATGRRMTWYFRHSTAELREDGKKVRSSRSICAVDACPDAVKMRKVVGAACAALKEGRDPLAAARTVLAEVLRLPETRVSENPSLHTWDFNTFREQFKTNPPSDLRQDTIDGYYRAMSEAQVGEIIYAKRLVEVTPQDIRKIRDDIRQRGHVRQSALTLQALRTAFEWATESPHSILSGLTEDNNPMLRVVSKRRRNKRKPTNEDAIAAAELIKVDSDDNIVVEDPKLITMVDIGKLLILLLQPTGLALVKRAILLLLFYSVQRRRTVASALRKALVGFVQRKIAFWVLDGGTTKSGRPHILPFSLSAWCVIESWSAMPTKSVWLFPGMATHRKPVPNGHVNVRTVNEWFYEACDLAECSRRYNPHAVRKAFGTYLSKKGISKEDRKLVLDHAEGRVGVTEINYNYDPKLFEKQKVMSVWNSFLDECIELARKSAKAPSLTEKDIRVLATPENTSNAPFVLRPPQVPAQLPAAVTFHRPVPIARASDAARLDKLRAKLNSRKQLDETLDRASRKRSLS